MCVSQLVLQLVESPLILQRYAQNRLVNFFLQLLVAHHFVSQFCEVPPKFLQAFLVFLPSALRLINLPALIQLHVLRLKYIEAVKVIVIVLSSFRASRGGVLQARQV